MLFDNAAKWKDIYIQEGEERGERRGEKIGEAIGCRRMLLILLEDRFGTIPESVNSFIASSDAEPLYSLGLFANKAPSMQAITDHIKGMQHCHKQRQNSLYLTEPSLELSDRQQKMWLATQKQ